MSENKPKYEQAFADYQAGLKYKEIAEKYNVSLATVKSWKTRHWNGKKSMHTKDKKVCIQKNKGGAPKGNKNATGPPGNKHASKHGLFERYLPTETLEIVNEIKVKSPLDILWDQILLAYAAIIRAQKVMFVEGKKDHDIIKSGYSDGAVSGETWAVTSATDKQGTFLSSLSRVQAQLNNMIKQYDKMVREDPLATEEQKARIENIKARTEILKGGNLEIEDTEDLDNEIFGQEENNSV